jgi:4-amino-4-deoxy-L-arabinose transferase-like glycosyltransferase
MAEIRRFGATDALLLAGVLALAAGARAGYLISCADQAGNGGPLLVQTPPPVVEPPPPPSGDEPPRPPATELDVLVRNLKGGDSFTSPAPFAQGEEPTAHVAPGYPWLLAMLARAVDPAALERTVRWVQCGLGALTAGLYFLFARRAFGRLVAVLAGLLCAVHPFWVIDTAAVNDGVVSTFLVGLALWLGGRAANTGAAVVRTGPHPGYVEGGPFASLLYGLTLAGVALVRAALLPFAFVALCWLLLRSRDLTRGWLCALLAFLGFVNGLAPWTFRNYQVFGEPLPVVDSAYLHLWVGNNPHADGGPLTDDMVKDAPTEELANIDKQPERYAHLGGLVRQEVSDRPVETVRRRLLAGLDFFFGKRWLTDGVLAERVEGVAMPDWLAWTYPVALEWALVVLVPLALLGWRWTYAFRRAGMPASLAAFWIPLPYVLSHAEALSGARLPLDGVLLSMAAFAVACFLPGVGRRLREGDRRVVEGENR